MSHRARKRFGQNFLNDRGVIERIVDAVGEPDDTPLVEIGPGLAALTLPLLERHGCLNVIEVDRDLVAKLKSRNLPGLVVHEGDALEVDFVTLAQQLDTRAGSRVGSRADDRLDPAKLRLVGNLPYNIGTPLILKLVRQQAAVRSLHVMLQLEVIERLTATPGNKHWGRLSVMTNAVFDITRLFDVPPEAFDPAPKVQSAVARLVPRESVPTQAQLDVLEKVARLAFANRRKTLRNNFKGILAPEALEQAGVNPGDRAERLELNQLQALAELLPVSASDTMPGQGN
jgi:16S rRNA (adenine1518-N6/adenine1519-N6)-dimethyltransferase